MHAMAVIGSVEAWGAANITRNTRLHHPQTPVHRHESGRNVKGKQPSWPWFFLRRYLGLRAGCTWNVDDWACRIHWLSVAVYAGLLSKATPF
jgi:hypothetical protein